MNLQIIDFENLMDGAVRAGATDVHITVGKVPRLRVDRKLVMGACHNIMERDTVLGVIEYVLSQLKGEEAAKRRAAWDSKKDVDCAFTYKSMVRVRVNIFRTEKGESIAFRIMQPRRFSVTEIGIPFPAVEFCNAKGGFFLVSGAAGSGKTTTLAALIDVINKTRTAHILTVEDPVEYIFEDNLSIISQREVGVHVDSFYSALRSSLRENPDVVVVGELRDLETTRIAIEMAETGHLVFATLHSRGAVSSIDRLVGQFPAGEQNQIRQMISESLLGILSQRLFAKKGGGLVAAFELLCATPAVRNLIREQKYGQICSTIQTGADYGMVTMESSIARLIQLGKISADSMNKDW
ncbi:tfp pilus assembly protein [Coraliomargarita sp. CAG:312]|nr:tfp pilus assembly protein [Coraliomargarita sp. CAG:312]